VHGSARTGERGVAILIVVMLTLVVSALGATAVVMSNTNHLIAAAERDSERALLASKAGLEYGFYLYTQGAVPQSAAPVPFDSFAPAVRDPLDGASFTGSITSMTSGGTLGQVYRIEATGRFNRAARTTEVVLQVVNDSYQYGYVAFSDMELHHHNRAANSGFHVESTIFSNGDVEVQPDITLDGTIVAGGEVWVTNRATVKGSVFANEVKNYGTIEGKTKSLGSLDEIPSDATRWDRVDSTGNKYNWFGENTSAGGIMGDGRFLGGKTVYTVSNGDEFKDSVFRKDGRVQSAPDVNVVKYLAPPQLDYVKMKRDAQNYEPTYFASTPEAMSYLASKKVTETIEGKTVTTIRVGTDTFPEFLYVKGEFKLKLDPAAAADDPANGILKADGFDIEGGIYATGTISFNGPTFDPARHPAPPAWYQFRINALPYCYPALVAYQEPLIGSPDSWSPDDTPILSASGSKIEISSAHTEDGSETPVPEGFVYINGLTYSQGETHLHHTKTDQELIRFNGAEMAYKVHSCDFMSFTYDPAVRCSAFVTPAQVGGTPQVVSYREIR